MDLKKRWYVVAGTVLAAGVLLVGSAFASGGKMFGLAHMKPSTPEMQQHMQQKLDDAVKSGKLTQAEADVLRELSNLHASYMQRLQEESKALIEKNVQSGKLTREQADRMLQGGPRSGMKGDHPRMKGHPGPRGDWKRGDQKPDDNSKG